MKKYILLVALAFSPMLYGAAAPAGVKLVIATYTPQKGKKPKTKVHLSSHSLLTYTVSSDADDTNDLVEILKDPIYKNQINERDPRGFSALDIAAAKSHCKTMKLLFKNGAKVINGNNYFPLKGALVVGDADTVNLLIDTLMIQDSTAFTHITGENSFLMDAVNTLNPKMVALILSKIPSSLLAAELEKRNDTDCTPLTAALSYKINPSIRVFLPSQAHIPADQVEKNIQAIIIMLQLAQVKANRLSGTAAAGVASAAPEEKKAAAAQPKKVSAPKSELRDHAKKEAAKHESPKTSEATKIAKTEKKVHAKTTHAPKQEPVPALLFAAGCAPAGSTWAAAVVTEPKEADEVPLVEAGDPDGEAKKRADAQAASKSKAKRVEIKKPSKYQKKAAKNKSVVRETPKNENAIEAASREADVAAVPMAQRSLAERLAHAENALASRIRAIRRLRGVQEKYEAQSDGWKRENAIDIQRNAKSITNGDAIREKLEERMLELSSKIAAQRNRSATTEN